MTEPDQHPVDASSTPPAAVARPADLDVIGFDRNTDLVAGERLPAAGRPVEYTFRDFLISDDIASQVHTAQPKNTERNIRHQVKLFEQWCAERRRVALPCTTATLIEYVGWMINSGRYDPNTVSKYMSAVVTWQERCTPGRTRPATVEVREMVAAFRTRWAKSSTEKQSPEVREADLEAMLATCGRGLPADLRDAAILTLGWHLLTRRIELHRLIVTHLVVRHDGIDVRLVNRNTRTDGSAFEGWVSTRDDAPHLCPVRRMRAWLAYGRRIRQPRDQALFRALDKAGRLAVRLTPQTRPQHPDGTLKDDCEITAEEWAELSRLSGGTVNGIVKRRAKAAFAQVAQLAEHDRAEAGHSALINAETARRVTAHSLRVGGTAELKEAGVPEDRIAELGDWRRGSTAMQRYFRRIKVKQQDPWTAARQARQQRQAGTSEDSQT
ncbi:hypothetical protein [Kitasatospora sp. NPDC085879]|uniref:hypothetical protein n=1 Tax=Kitasatospora sp. NPDC085879 TaxID=3154769 RepID=UPI00343F2EE4